MPLMRGKREGLLPNLTRAAIRASHGLLLNRPCPHNEPLVKVKEPRRSVSQLLRDPEVRAAEETGFQWSCLFLALPLFEQWRSSSKKKRHIAGVGQDGFKLKPLEMD